MAAEAVDFDHYARAVVAYYGLSGVTVRPSAKADFRRVTEIQVLALCGRGRDLYGADRIRRFVERNLRQTLALCGSAGFFVAERGGDILGCGGWCRIAETATRSRPHAVCFYVDPQYGRHGVGRSLLAITEAAARASGVNTLSALAPLHGTELFRNAGYAAADIAPLDLGDDFSIDLLLMRKRLAA